MASGPTADSQRLLQELVADTQQHGLVLFVGAGINAGYLSQWDALLTSLLEEAVGEAEFEDPRADGLAETLTTWCKTQFDVCAQASIVKHVLGAERFRLEIQDALYGGKQDAEQEVKRYCRSRHRRKAIDKKPHLELLWRVAELCSLPQVKGVATFNFDTLLEHAIQGCGVRTPRAYFGQVATVDERKLGLEDLPVFHLHGLLSPPGTLLRCPQESVVFSYDEYFEKNADPLSWETSSALHLLRNFCTLWLGASLKDWNMLRLLDAARSGRREVHSYCLQCLQEAGSLPAGTTKAKNKRFQQVAMRLQATMFDAVGMRLVIAGDEFKHIRKTIARQITRPLANSGK